MRKDLQVIGHFPEDKKSMLLTALKPPCASQESTSEMHPQLGDKETRTTLRIVRESFHTYKFWAFTAETRLSSC